MNTFSKNDIKLRSVSLAGNNLENPISTQILVQTFRDLFEKSFLQHMDLSLTGIDKNSDLIRGILHAMK